MGCLLNREIDLDRFRCRGCGACVEVCPDAFCMDEDGEKAKVIDSAKAPDEAVQLAVAMCPTQCIELHKREERGGRDLCSRMEKKG